MSAIPDGVARRWRGLALLYGSLMSALAALAALSLLLPATAGAEEPTTSVAPYTTPSTHSYDDADTDGGARQGVSPAVWILVGAVIGLTAVAVMLARSGQAGRCR